MEVNATILSSILRVNPKLYEMGVVSDKYIKSLQENFNQAKNNIENVCQGEDKLPLTFELINKLEVMKELNWEDDSLITNLLSLMKTKTLTAHERTQIFISFLAILILSSIPISPLPLIFLSKPSIFSLID